MAAKPGTGAATARAAVDPPPPVQVPGSQTDRFRRASDKPTTVGPWETPTSSAAPSARGPNLKLFDRGSPPSAAAPSAAPSAATPKLPKDKAFERKARELRKGLEWERKLLATELGTADVQRQHALLAAERANELMVKELADLRQQEPTTKVLVFSQFTASLEWPPWPNSTQPKIIFCGHCISVCGSTHVEDPVSSTDCRVDFSDFSG